MNKKLTQKNNDNCRRIKFRNKGQNIYIYYSKPINKNDMKRYGKYMEIEFDGVSVRLNGRQINSIKKALKSVGEIGGKIDKQKCKIW